MCKLQRERDAIKDRLKVEISKVSRLKDEVRHLQQYHWDYNWDQRGTGVVGVDRDIVLIRHGEYFKSIPPYGLTARGEEQASAAGRYINSLLARKRLSVHSIIHSGLQRAKETANKLVAALDSQQSLTCCALLNEGDPSDVRNSATLIPNKFNVFVCMHACRIHCGLTGHSGSTSTELHSMKL